MALPAVYLDQLETKNVDLMYTLAQMLLFPFTIAATNHTRGHLQHVSRAAVPYEHSAPTLLIDVQDTDR